MEGDDGAYALDLVNMTTSLRERLAEQRLRGAFAKQEQPLWLCELDMLAGDFGAGLAVRGRQFSARRVDAIERCRISIFGRYLDRCQHSLRQLPGFAANWLSGGQVLERGRIRQQHDLGVFRAMWHHPL